MSLLERVEKIIPPPILYIGGIVAVWYQLSFRLQTDSRYMSVVISPVFRYGLSISLFVILFIELRSQTDAPFWELLKAKKGVLSFFLYVNILCAVTIIGGICYDIESYAETRRLSSIAVESYEIETEGGTSVKCDLQSRDGSVIVVCMKYAWMKTNHYDLDLASLQIVKDSIAIGPGDYRFIALQTDDPSLFDEIDYHVDEISPNSDVLEFSIPTQEQTQEITKNMVLVNEGVFLRGSDNNVKWGSDRKPEVKIHLHGYYIDVYETTNLSYLDFLLHTHHPPPDYFYPDRVSYQKENSVRARFPVVGVDWYDARAFSQYRRKRLPTEAEWEKAARSGGTLVYPWGNEFDDGNLVLVRRYKDPKVLTSGHTQVIEILQIREVDHDLNAKDKTGLGVVGMAGNAREWCLDLYRRNYNTSNTDAVLSRMRLRRGAFIETTLPEKLAARADYRDYGSPSKAYVNTGVRCVRSQSYHWIIDRIDELGE